MSEPRNHKEAFEQLGQNLQLHPEVEVEIFHLEQFAKEDRDYDNYIEDLDYYCCNEERVQ